MSERLKAHFESLAAHLNGAKADALGALRLLVDFANKSEPDHPFAHGSGLRTYIYLANHFADRGLEEISAALAVLDEYAKKGVVAP